MIYLAKKLVLGRSTIALTRALSFAVAHDRRTCETSASRIPTHCILESMKASESEALVRHAFTELKKLSLSWYSGITATKKFLI